MSKKKVASRSAMTLKDFHGGSIPSDLPLPSAPGMTVDRSVFERQGSGTWMSPTLGRGYSNDRSAYHRQGSTGGVRTFEDKASYFPNPANIGRNYDEDERKPVDSRPRSGHSADRFDDHSYDERRGGYLGDRYALEEQPNFSESRGSGASDRFPPSQVAGGGYEADVYVHDEFGLIPVGPPPARGTPAPPQDIPSRPQPSSYQREVMPETRVEQSSYVQIQQQMPTAPPPYSSSQPIAASPPRSWRNPAHQVQRSPAPAASQLSPESSTNVWTARRDGGDFNKVQTPEVSSDSLGSSSPWRPQSIVGRAVDKVSSGRWQADASRPSSGRWQADSSREPVQPKAAGAEEPSAGYGAYGADTARQSYGEDVSETHRYVGSDPERGGHSGTGRAPYVDSRGGHSFDDGRPDVNDQSKAGYRDVSRVGFGSGGNGSTSSNGRFVPSEPSAPIAGDRNLLSDGGDGSLSAATETSREPPQPELTERPKLKLLPRSKPLEVETPKAETEDVVKFEEISEKVLGLLGLSDNRQQPEVPYAEAFKLEPAGANDETDEDSNRKVERPRLNLKPRSQPPEAEAVEGSQKVRQLVFGGARPRELVLKERGVDDVVDVAPDVAVTPGTTSLPAPASAEPKVEASKYQRPEIRSEEKPDNVRYERPDRSYERQGSHRVDRQDSGRGDRGLESKWDREKDNQWDQERPDGPRRREFDRQDSRRDTESRRDIDKQDNWRKPAESPAAAIGVKSSGSALVDPSPRGSGRAASAVELAQAFSRSSSLGSTMTGSARGSNNLRTPLSPMPKGSVQGFAPGYGNGTASRDASFSRLAEASPPPYSASSAEMYLPGSDYGLDSQSSYFGTGKLGGYPSSDLKRGSSFGRAETGRDFMEDNGGFPGKRGLPVRQRDGYFD